MITTPFGAPVEPDVYCSSAMASGSGATTAISSPAASSIVSAGATGSAAVARVVSSSFASQSRAIAASRARPRLPLGGGAGTAIMPARKHANSATTKSPPAGNARITRAPRGSLPASIAATRRADDHNTA